MHVGQKGMDEAAGFLWLLHKEIYFSHAKAQGTIPFKDFPKVLSSKEAPKTLKDHGGPLVIHMVYPQRELPLHLATGRGFVAFLTSG